MASDLNMLNVSAVLVERFPEFGLQIQEAFGDLYDLPNEHPGDYLIFENLVQPFLWKQLEEGNAKILTQLFKLFEEMAASDDANLPNLLAIAIVRPLVYRRNGKDYALARKYVGGRMETIAIEQVRKRPYKDNFDGVDFSLILGENGITELKR